MMNALSNSPYSNNHVYYYLSQILGNKYLLSFWVYEVIKDGIMNFDRVVFSIKWKL